MVIFLFFCLCIISQIRFTGLWATVGFCVQYLYQDSKSNVGLEQSGANDTRALTTMCLFSTNHTCKSGNIEISLQLCF